MMNILILANGHYGDIQWYRQRIASFTKIICADGGTRMACLLGQHGQISLGTTLESAKVTLEGFVDRIRGRVSAEDLIDPATGEVLVKLLRLFKEPSRFRLTSTVHHMEQVGLDSAPLVALLCYAGLRAIPDAYYQAAKIDGASRWAVFRFIQLPKMRGVMTIAVLLRFMDSFLIYAEPFVLTGGGPGNSTTFLSIYLVKLSTAMDLGPAAAFSIIYFLIVLLFCWLFYQALQAVGTGEKS